MADRPTRRVDAEVLRDLMERMLMAAGCPQDLAGQAATVHLEADLRGYGVQGLDHMTDVLRDIKDGRVEPTGRPEIVGEGEAWAQISGHMGIGHPAALLAAETAAAKAKGAGCAVVGIKDSADIYIIGYYAELMARAGVIGLVTTIVPPLVHPHGGTEPILGTNPLAIGIPTGEANPVLLDMSTSIVAASQVRHARYHDEHMAPGTGVGPTGEPTTLAADIEKGAIAPMAGHRGYGLALCLGIMAGPLVGSATGHALDGWHSDAVPLQGFGHCMIAVSPAVFGALDTFEAAVGTHLEEIRESRPARGVDRVRIPGDRSLAQRERSLADGIEMLEASWASAGRWAAELGVAMPD